MNTAVHPSLETRTVSPSLRTWIIAVSVLQFVLMLLSVIVLSSSINWPASLDAAPAEILPLIHREAGNVALGYSAYFLSAFLLAPLALMVAAQWHGKTANALLWIGVALGVSASVFKLLGIVRWLVLMPGLANTYVSSDATPATQLVTGQVYQAFNAYAGGIGEMLGVQIFAGLWTIVVALLAARVGLPRWVSVMGHIAAVLLLAGLLERFGFDLGPVLSVSNVFWQVWLLVLAFTVTATKSVRA